jgi:hypothetical protein
MGRIPCPPACPTRAHLRRTWTDKDAPPPLRGGQMNLEAPCHVLCKATVFLLPTHYVSI